MQYQSEILKKRTLFYYNSLDSYNITTFHKAPGNEWYNHYYQKPNLWEAKSREFNNLYAHTYLVSATTSDPDNLAFDFDNLSKHLTIKEDDKDFESICRKMDLAVYALIGTPNMKNVFNPPRDMFLGVVELGPTKGLHMHIVQFSHRPITKVITTKINELLGTKWHYTRGGISTYTVKPVVKDEPIKSIASFLHYLKKQPLFMMTNSWETYMMFINFDRCHIFDVSSLPRNNKTLKDGTKICSTKPEIIYFYQKFDEGIITYQEIQKDPNFMQFLHIGNIKSIFDNCLSQFIASNEHYKHILKLLNEASEHKYVCACPVIDWLTFQDIEVKPFIIQIVSWLLKSDAKKNCLVFEGCPNSGKSHIARLIWKTFTHRSEVVPDSHFLFANIIGTGCALYEEPHINSDTVDTCKAVFEGHADAQIARKNQSSQPLGKAVPFVITTNKSLWSEVSSERAAFVVRCHFVTPDNSISLKDFCNTNIHYCPHIKDRKLRPIETSDWSASIKNKRRRTSESEDEVCSVDQDLSINSEICDFHTLHKCELKHMYAFLVFALLTCKDNLVDYLKNNCATSEQTAKYCYLIDQLQQKFCRNTVDFKYRNE